MSWLQLLSSTEPQALKERVSLAAVVIEAGVDLKPNGERLVGLCPFHDDHDASFAVFRLDDGSELCGCWSCDFKPGDVFDFIQRVHSCTFPKAVQIVQDYIRDGLPTAPAIPERDPDAPAVDLSGVTNTARNRDLAPLHSLLHDKEIEAPADWVAAEFRVGVGERGEIIIPHYSQEDELRGAKHRDADRSPIAFSGSRLDSLYGAWRDRGQPYVIVCEGESDTWATAWLFREDDVLVVGLPSGVSARVKETWVDQLRDRVVTLMFDADDAGRRGCAHWVGKVAGPAKELRIASLPEGEDAVSAGPAATRMAVSEAWPFKDPATLPISVQGDYYVKINPTTGQGNVLSDFIFSVERLVMGDDEGITIEVRVPTKQRTQVLTSAELSNPQKLREWCARRMLSWKGGSRDVADLLELIKCDLILAPRVKGTDIIGLHDGSYVLPDATIGAASWGYMRPTADVGLEKVLDLEPSDRWDRRVPYALSQIHDPSVITPVMGWIAAAPLRELCHQFPILAVVGGAGWGKTTLVSVSLDTFGFWTGSPTTLTATTPHAIHSYAASTNAFPVWFDEYRAGARAEAKLALDQVLRDAWDGSAAVKGGQSENLSAVKQLFARAPMLVTGEDAFSETSHAERMVLIPMPREGRNAEALRAVRSMDHRGFGHAYLRWLVQKMNRDELAAPPHMEGRMEQARAVAEWGWDLLTEFTREQCGMQLPPFDDSRVRAEHERMDATPQMIDVMLEAMNRTTRDGQQMCWIEGNDICVRPVDLVRWAKTETDIVLPGGSKAFQAWLSERFTTRVERGMFRHLRLVGAARELNLS